MRGILQVDRWGDRRSYAFLRGRPLRDRGQDSVGVVMSPEPPANFNIERDIPRVIIDHHLSEFLYLGIGAALGCQLSELDLGRVRDH